MHMDRLVERPKFRTKSLEGFVSVSRSKFWPWHQSTILLSWHTIKKLLKLAVDELLLMSQQCT